MASQHHHQGWSTSADDVRTTDSKMTDVIANQHHDERAGAGPDDAYADDNGDDLAPPVPMATSDVPSPNIAVQRRVKPDAGKRRAVDDAAAAGKAKRSKTAASSSISTDGAVGGGAKKHRATTTSESIAAPSPKRKVTRPKAVTAASTATTASTATMPPPAPSPKRKSVAAKPKTVAPPPNKKSTSSSSSSTPASASTSASGSASASRTPSPAPPRSRHGNDAAANATRADAVAQYEPYSTLPGNLQSAGDANWEYKLTFNQPGVLKHMLAVVSKVLTNVPITVERGDRFTGISIETMDPGKTSMIVARLTCHVRIFSDDVDAFMYFKAESANSCLDLVSSSSCLKVERYRSEDHLRFTSFEGNSMVPAAGGEIHLLEDETEAAWRLQEMEHTYSIEIQRETMCTLIKNATKLKADDIEFEVLEPEGQDDVDDAGKAAPPSSSVGRNPNSNGNGNNDQVYHDDEDDDNADDDEDVVVVSDAAVGGGGDDDYVDGGAARRGAASAQQRRRQNGAGQNNNNRKKNANANGSTIRHIFIRVNIKGAEGTTFKVFHSITEWQPASATASGGAASGSSASASDPLVGAYMSKTLEEDDTTTPEMMQSLRLKFQAKYPVDKIGMFIRAMNRNMLTLHLSEGCPMMITYPLGNEDSYIKYVLMPKCLDV